MGKLIQLGERLKRFDTEAELLLILKEVSPQMIDLNTGQLFSGVDSNGFLLKPYYRNDKYAEFKKTLNSKGVVDLKLTGDFYDGFFADVSKFPLIFGSNDEKSNELEKRYGKNIFGLNKRSLNEISKQTIQPEIIIAIRKIIYV